MLRDAPLETQRLQIRRMAPADADWLTRLFADPAVAQYVGDGGSLTPADARLWVSRSNENVERFGYGTGIVVVKATDTRVGWAGVARPGNGSEEMVYGLARAHWGRGYGSEIVAALVMLLERSCPESSICATVDRTNRVSILLLERHGFALAEHDHHGETGTDLYRRPPG